MSLGPDLPQVCGLPGAAGEWTELSSQKCQPVSREGGSRALRVLELGTTIRLPPPGLPSGRSGSALPLCTGAGSLEPHMAGGGGGAPWRKVKGASLTILLGNHRGRGEGKREFKDAGCFPEPGEESS